MLHLFIYTHSCLNTCLHKEAEGVYNEINITSMQYVLSLPIS